MKKKLLSLALSLVLLCSLAVPAAAQPEGGQSADDRLSAVTAQVKAVLDLDTEGYTEFYGNLDENLLAPTWYLEWYGEEGSLSVSCTEEGKVLSLHRYDNEDDSDDGVFSFPDGDQDAAREAARAFLDKILTEGESVTLEDRPLRLSATHYRFYGEVLLNGLPAGLSWSISVRCRDNAVTSFYRDDLNGQIMGDVPSAEAAVTAAEARTALRDTLALRLEYVLPEGEGKQARLRYLPEYGDEYYVDAATGELVNLTELAADLSRGDSGSNASGGAAYEEMGTDAAAAETPEPLSAAEQVGVDKLEGVLDKDALDAKARAVEALGLEAYTLATVNYAVAREDETAEEVRPEPAVTATLRYGRQVGGESWRRTVTLDAKTGALLSVYSSAWMPEDGLERPVDVETAQETVAAFLEEQCGGQFAKTALYESTDALERGGRISHSLTYAQQENGCFYTGNAIYVGVDATDGSISSYEKYFDDAVTFDSPEGILTMDEALDAWLATYDVPLAYIQVPAAVDYSQPEYAPLRDYGISYLYRLVLGYGLEREGYLAGIDAKTGEAVQPAWAAEEEPMTYSDVAGHWAQTQIETLAKYSVGYRGGAFRPDSALTQLDLVALLASTEGYLYNGGEESAADDLYEYAYALGLLGREERDDDAVLTRSDTVRMILDAAGYGPIARLEGIFRTSFADEQSIDPADYGYAALAQGLGVVSGAPGAMFLPHDAATRAQAAVMLYNLMAR